jgi:hypothetical protein
MAARKPREQWTPEVVRQRIKTSHIVSVLQRHIRGALELSPTQVRAAEILLRKTLPDQSAIAHAGTLDLRKAEDLSDSALAHIASSSGDRITEASGSQKEPSELH